MSTAKPVSILVSALVWLALAGCQDQITRPENALPSATQLVRTLEPGIHAVVALPSPSEWVNGTGTVRIHLLTVKVSGMVQSYQGWIRFDPKLMQVTEGNVAPGVLGAWNEVAAGEIRFAGVSIEGVGDDHVIELGVHATRPLIEGDLSIELDEVTGSLETTPFQDLTPRVRRADATPAISPRDAKR